MALDYRSRAFFKESCTIDGMVDAVLVYKICTEKRIIEWIDAGFPGIYLKRQLVDILPDLDHLSLIDAISLCRQHHTGSGRSRAGNPFHYTNEAVILVW